MTEWQRRITQAQLARDSGHIEMSFDDSSDRQISELGNSLNKGLTRN
jgi:hypothetical protein